VHPLAFLRGVIVPPAQKPGAGGERVGHVSSMQQPTPMPPPHDAVVALAQWPFWQDDGERPTQVPPAAAHVLVRAMMSD
jgi:hypothetical protein